MSLESHSAPGAAAAFEFQFERAVYWLAQSPAGFTIGIETDDDVSIKHDDGSRTLEQDKHSIRDKAEPFGDRSKDLWNTLLIWASALELGELESGKTKFLMVTNKALPACIARQISDAHSTEEVENCVEALRSASTNPPETIRAISEKLLSTSTEPHLRTVIASCELLDENDGLNATDLRKATSAELQIPSDFLNSTESIVDELNGWVRRQVLQLWQHQKPAWITRDSFVTQFHAILNRRKRRLSRERAAHLIPVIDDQLGQEKGRMFVKQIYLVTDEDSRADEAIREYVRCRIEKARLSADGNITDQDWIDFEDTLLSRWAKIFDRMPRLRRDWPEEDVGFEILTETTDEHRERLAGVETEQVYLTAGTYHRMADRLIVGWHPRFKDLIKKDREE